MSRRHAKRFLTAPVDARARRIVSASHIGKRGWILTLECGHQTKRRFLAVPTHVVCTACPAAGGMGGTDFGKTRG